MTTKKQAIAVNYRLFDLGLNDSEAYTLRRIAMTLSRWDEAECNGEIERDEATGTPYRYPRPGMSDYHYKTADKERGAEKRLNAIMAAHPDLWAYRQGDPRGASLYIGRKESLPEGSRIDSVYSSFGVAVY